MADLICTQAEHYLPMRTWLVAVLVAFSVVAHITPARDAAFIPNDQVCQTSTVTSQIVQCLANEVTRSDHALHRLYTLILQELAAGAVPDPYPKFFDDKKTHLQEAERAWATFKEAQCGLEAELLAPGTGVPIEYESCVLKLTNERFRFLTRYEAEISRDSNLCQAAKPKCSVP